MCSKNCIKSFSIAKGHTFSLEKGGKVIRVGNISKYVGDVEIVHYTGTSLIFRELHAIDDMVIEWETKNYGKPGICDFVRERLHNSEIPSTTINNRRQRLWDTGRLFRLYSDKTTLFRRGKGSVMGKPGTFAFSYKECIGVGVR